MSEKHHVGTRFGDGLNKNERRILELLAEGAGTNKEVGDIMNYSPHWVKYRLESIRIKLGATNRTDAVAKAIRQGLI
jgi:LuxR family quorum sensing-dependent transcriptional regulator